jgi:outer membrane immunogenic protein
MVNWPLTKIVQFDNAHAQGVFAPLSGWVATIARFVTVTRKGPLKMMTNMIRAGIAATALLIAPIAAQSADLPRSYKAPAYSAPAYANWSGFYVGINGGYGFGKSSWSGGGISTGDFNVKGAQAGLTAGYNFQTGTWVWGLEGDLDWSGIKGTTTVNCVTTCETKNEWMGTARGRIGYAGWNNLLPYLTGGAAFGNIKGTGAAGSVTKTNVGWTAGVGLEYAFLGAWSAKLEYLYADLGKATCEAATCGVATDIKFNANLVRVGLNYRF